MRGSQFVIVIIFIGNILAAAALHEGSSLARAAGGSSPPNFILAMADDQGWGDVGYYGNPIPKTPTLDRMAAGGLRCDRFYAAAPVCSPTRGSVLTGRHPNRFGCFSWGHTLRPAEVTVAEVLQAAGYATGHFGKWHLGSVRADSDVSPGKSGFEEWFSSPNFFENSPLLSHNGQVVQTEGESSRVIVDAALDFMRSASRAGRPFLAVIWFGNPHAPHQALRELREKYPDQSPRLQNYYGEITGIDQAMGHLRGELRSLGIAENTLLWYTSDNGPQAPQSQPGSAGGLRGRKGSLWEGGIRVPTILEWPARITRPRTTDVPCGTVDILPTLLELAGLTADEHSPPWDGVSLVPLIDGKMARRSRSLGFWVYPAPGIPMRSHDLLVELRDEQQQGKQRSSQAVENAPAKPYSDVDLPGRAAWIDNAWKLHRIPGAAGAVRYELYNLAADDAEANDLIAAQPQRARQMQAALEEWQKSVIHSCNGGDYRSR